MIKKIIIVLFSFLISINAYADLFKLNPYTGKMDNVFGPPDMVDKGGNVGVGTTVPSAKFQVNGTIYLNGTGSGSFASPNGIEFDPNNASGLNLNPLVTMTSGYNVGIGTGNTSPGATLHVAGNTFLSQAPNFSKPELAFDANGANFPVVYTPGGATDSILKIGPSTDKNTNATSSTISIDVDTNNVGIGTESGRQRLDVQGTIRTTNLTISAIASGTQCLQANGSGVVSGTGAGCGGAGSSPGGGLNAIQYNSPVGTFAGKENVFSFNGANVGIGTTNGINLLDVQGTVNANVFEVTGPGNVGIGSNNPGQILDVQGTIRSTQMIDTGVTASSVVVTTAGKQFVAATNLTDVAYLPVTGATAGATTQAQTFTDGVTVPSTGSVLINNQATSALEVANSAGNAALVIAGSDGGGSIGQIALSSSGHQQLVLDAGADITGKDSSANSTFALDNQTATTGRLRLWNGATKNVEMSANNASYFTGQNFGFGSSSDPGKTLGVGSSNQMTVDSSGNIATSGGYTQSGSSLDLFTGNVGINSATPGQILDVQGTIRASANINDKALTASSPVISDANKNLASGTYKGNTTVFQMNNGALTSGNLIKSDANSNTVDAAVSFGTLTDTKFCTYSSGSTSIACTSSAGSGTVNSGTTGQVGYYASSTTAVSGSSALIVTGNASGNNIGIGSASPGAILDVQGTVRVFGNIGISTSSPGYLLDVNGGGRFLGSGNTTLNPTSGNVGIGTPSPTGFEVEGMNVGIGTSSVGSNGAKVLIFGGNVGIGTVSPGVALDVKGDIRDNDFSGQVSGTIMCVKTGGAMGYCSGTIVGVGCTCN